MDMHRETPNIPTPLLTNFADYAYTVQLTGNVAGTPTTRHASTRETCEGAGIL